MDIRLNPEEINAIADALAARLLPRLAAPAAPIAPEKLALLPLEERKKIARAQWEEEKRRGPLCRPRVGGKKKAAQ